MAERSLGACLKTQVWLGNPTARPLWVPEPVPRMFPPQWIGGYYSFSYALCQNVTSLQTSCLSRLMELTMVSIYQPRGVPSCPVLGPPCAKAPCLPSSIHHIGLSPITGLFRGKAYHDLLLTDAAALVSVTLFQSLQISLVCYMVHTQGVAAYTRPSLPNVLVYFKQNFDTSRW
ncbi:hypothetical protein BV22DRAFT_589012 [Leucogyrophana mollusca]|uniref:Uncharacterized protein n=1 Tax=Leucogyrophana mollusca TaxID=85980 RepID=A0ACB8BCB6_9AGAM|nr:hypothetical protein BV22DRAFT_589012 [Leucogyrophana mollusca]